MVGGVAAPTLHVGVPMWARREWVGVFLPRDTRPGGELAAYGRYLNAVEGNTTFYAAPTPATVARWLEQTPDGFWFTFKLPQVITHERRLRDVAAPMRAFLDLMAPLHPRTGALTVQLPPSFGPGDLDALAAFVRRLPHDWRWCVEVRHPAFSVGQAADALDTMLERAGVERVSFDTTTLFAEPPASPAERIAWERKPRLPVRTHPLTDRPVVRYLGRDDLHRTAAGWRPWIPVVAAWLAEGRHPMFFVHTPDDLASPGLARQFHAEVAAVVPALASLPDLPRDVEAASVAGCNEQSRLF